MSLSSQASPASDSQSPLVSPQPVAREVRRLDLPSLLSQHRLGRALMVVQGSELRDFLALLDTPQISMILKRDRCYAMADRYLLATVFVYFKRAELRVEEYTERNFWLALYLAHDQEEDDDKIKWELLPWALGLQWQPSYWAMMRDKEVLWRRMGHRSLVSRRQCDQVMALSASAAVWARTRTACHGGAKRSNPEEQYIPRGPLQPTPVCARCPVRKEVQELQGEEKHDVLGTLGEEEELALVSFD